MRLSSVHNWSSVLTKGFCICQNQDATLPLAAVWAPLNWQLLWFLIPFNDGSGTKIGDFLPVSKSHEIFSIVFSTILSEFRALAWLKNATQQFCKIGWQVYSLSKTVKVSRVPILDSKLLSAPITFLLPELQKLVLKAKNGDLILIFAFGTTLLYTKCWAMIDDFSSCFYVPT